MSVCVLLSGVLEREVPFRAETGVGGSALGIEELELPEHLYNNVLIYLLFVISCLSALS